MVGRHHTIGHKHWGSAVAGIAFCVTNKVESRLPDRLGKAHSIHKVTDPGFVRQNNNGNLFWCVRFLRWPRILDPTQFPRADPRNVQPTRACATSVFSIIESMFWMKSVQLLSAVSKGICGLVWDAPRQCLWSRPPSEVDDTGVSDRVENAGSSAHNSGVTPPASALGS